MTGHKVITIGRQFGSGGREIGQRLSEKLDIPLYDHRLVSMAAEQLGVRKEDAERVDESSLNSFVSSYTVTPGMYVDFINAASYVQSFDEDVYRKQSEIIRNLAQKGPCIIVGRCADYILRDKADCLTAFIHADIKYRAERIVNVYGEREEAPEQRIREKDKRCAAYHRFYTDMKWGYARNYQIALDSGVLGIDRCIEILKMLY